MTPTHDCHSMRMQRFRGGAIAITGGDDRPAASA
jgi:hypothetical protein